MGEDREKDSASPVEGDGLAEFDRLVDGGYDAPVESGEAKDEDSSRVSGWARVFRGNRALWIGAASAIVPLVGGLLVGTFVLAPADAAGDAPKPDLVTVPVELGPLSNDVTLRAEVGYADAVDVTIDTSTLSGAAVVTGQGQTSPRCRSRWR